VSPIPSKINDNLTPQAVDHPPLSKVSFEVHQKLSCVYINELTEIQVAYTIMNIPRRIGVLKDNMTPSNIKQALTSMT
jgi:hypothetical protein